LKRARFRAGNSDVCRVGLARLTCHRGSAPGPGPHAAGYRWPPDQEFVKALQTPEVKEALLAAGADAVGNTPAEFDAIIRMELKKWAKLVKDAGIKAD
jgi:hypothetical protein